MPGKRINLINEAELINTYKELCKQNVSCTQIAQTLNIPVRRVYKYKKITGIKRMTPDELMQAFKEMYENGVKVSDIAVALNISKRRCYQFKEKLGLKSQCEDYQYDINIVEYSELLLKNIEKIFS